MTDATPDPMSGYPPSLRVLLEKLQKAVQDLTASLEAGDLEAQAWQDGMEQLLARYSLAAYMTGADTTALTASDLATLAMIVQTQLEFLDNFTLVIQSEAEFQAGWTARAEQYAKSIANPYWKGKTKMLPLPAMPRDGTSQCLNNCYCKWDIQVIDEENGDWDCYWQLGQADHCQTCIERAAEWNPLKIRSGELVL